MNYRELYDRLKASGVRQKDIVRESRGLVSKQQVSNWFKALREGNPVVSTTYLWLDRMCVPRNVVGPTSRRHLSGGHYIESFDVDITGPRNVVEDEFYRLSSVFGLEEGKFDSSQQCVCFMYEGVGYGFDFLDKDQWQRDKRLSGRMDGSSIVLEGDFYLGTGEFKLTKV